MRQMAVCKSDQECTSQGVTKCVSGFCRRSDGSCENAFDCQSWMCDGGKCVDLNEAYEGVDAHVGWPRCPYHPDADNSCKRACAQFVASQKPGTAAFCDKWVCSNSFWGDGDDECEPKQQGPE